MKIAAIIAEYNPFHSGHAYQIARTRQLTGATHILVLMSGPVVQRGTFALTDKWFRARMALAGGADLVCELPYAACAQSAAFFAAGAVRLLNATGVTDILAFGSESGDLLGLTETATVLAKEPPAYRKALKDALETGCGFSTAQIRALSALPGYRGLLPDSPNTILGIEYIKALIQSGSAIQPFTLPRIGDGYHAAHRGDTPYASATWLREQIGAGATAEALAPYLPVLSDDLLTRVRTLQQDPLPWFYRGLCHRLLTADLSELRRYPDHEPGLEFAVKKALVDAPDYPSLVQALTARHLPAGRIRRYLMHVATGFTADDREAFSDNSACYLRVLGLNPRGREMLKQIRQVADLPVITNVRTNQTRLGPAARRAFDWDVRAEDLFDLYVLRAHACRRDYTTGPVIVTS